MAWIWWVIGAVALIAVLFVLILVYCFFETFYISDKEQKAEEPYPIPHGKIYEPYREQMIRWMKELEAMPCAEFSLISFDGLILRGKFYRYSDEAPIELMFPGYRGNAKRDLCGGVQRCFSVGHSALVIDQRAGGDSEGNVTSFGVNECRDCRAWIDMAIAHFGDDVKLILTGISMGAATVLLAAGEPLPKNVIGVLADCGYSSAEEIIKKVIAKRHLPPAVAYPFVRLAGRVFGGFDIDKASPMKAVEHCSVPIIFYHGEADAYVPCEMSRINYEHCASEKELITVPNAGHGLCYPVDPQTYVSTLRAFWEKVTCEKV